eukprot:364743-Chlamydomonas_euryale.AAC.52
MMQANNNDVLEMHTSSCTEHLCGARICICCCICNCDRLVECEASREVAFSLVVSPERRGCARRVVPGLYKTPVALVAALAQGLGPALACWAPEQMLRGLLLFSNQMAGA